MSTLALFDDFTLETSGGLNGQNSTSGHTWTDSTVTNFTGHLSRDSVPSASNASGTSSGMAISGWTPPGAGYGVGVLGQWTTVGTGGDWGVFLRVAGGLNGYGIYCYEPSVNEYDMVKYLGGTPSTEGTPYAHTPVAGVPAYLYLLALPDGTGGVNLTTYLNGTSIITAHDTSSPITAAGLVAITIFGAGGTPTTNAHIFAVQTDSQAGTLTGPSSGTNGVPSTTFTATLEVPATVNTTATLSDGGQGGTFSPTSLTWAGGTASGLGATAATFTYTPATAGALTLTVAVTTPATNFSLTHAYTSSGGGGPALSVSPTSATVALSGTQSITATLANSSAGLTASATHGTLSTSTPTSGVAFTYTAPSSGTIDTVTITDSTDSLTATCTITLTGGGGGATAYPASLLAGMEMGQTFRQTLYAKLQSIAPLTAIVGPAIYRGQLPQTHNLERNGPALTYSIVSMPRGQVLGGLDGTAMARVQFTAYDQGVDGAAANADAITLAILEALSVVPPANPWGDGTIVIRSVTQQDENDQDDEPKAGSDQWLYQQVSEYNISFWI